MTLPQPATFQTDPLWPEALIEYKALDEDSGERRIVMTWVTATLPGHDENGARGPYTHRMRADSEAGDSVTNIFASISVMMKSAVDNEARPKIDPSILVLLNATHLAANENDAHR